MYDIIILGGGISGLYCALELIKHNKKVCICEKYKNLGGRTLTYNQDGYQWEIGAGRISKDHTLLLELMKKYKQPISEISSDIKFMDKCLEPNIFEDLVKTYFYPLKQLDKKILASNTLRQLCETIYGKEITNNFLIHFPYRAEVDVLRADLGLESFSNEMGSHKGYYVAVNGFSNLIEAMAEDFKGDIFTSYKCIEINNKKEYIECKFDNGEILQAKKVVCALDSDASKKLVEFPTVTKHLKMEPLLRTYAVYPNCWFSQYPRIVTPNPIRYFLPISYEKNIAMVSYTDSKDTKQFHSILKKYGEDSLGKHIQNKLKELFGSSIPHYTYFKAHYWPHGATYWLPGNYDPVEESKKSLKPNLKKGQQKPAWATTEKDQEE